MLKTILCILFFAQKSMSAEPPTRMPPIFDMSTTSVCNQYHFTENVLEFHLSDKGLVAECMIWMVNTRCALERFDAEQSICITPQAKELGITLSKLIVPKLGLLWPIHTIDSQFLYSDDGVLSKKTSINKICLWPVDQLRQFTRENYKVIFYYACFYQFLPSEEINIDEKTFIHSICDDCGSLNRAKAYLKYSQLHNHTIALMGNFVNNIKNNLDVLSIPHHMWRTQHHSKISFEGTSETQKLMENHLRIANIFQRESASLSRLSNDEIQFAFLCLVYRHQAVFNLSRDCRANIIERYLYNGSLAYAYEFEAPTSILEKIRLTEDHVKQGSEQLEIKKNQLQKSVNRFTAAKNDVRAYQRKQAKLNQQITQIRQTIDLLDKEIQSTLAQEQQIESQNNHAVALITATQSHINDLSKEVVRLTGKINLITSIEDFSAEYNLAQDQLTDLTQQLETLRSIYNIYARDSELVRVQAENLRLCAENVALDAEIAELEVKLAGSSK